MEDSANSSARSLDSLLRSLTIHSSSAHSSSSVSSSSRQDEQAEISLIVQDLKDVKKNWEWIQALLTDAEERQIREKSVQLWLRDLRELAYEIEDLRDVYEYEVMAREVEASKAPSSSGDASTSERRKVEEPYVEVRPSMVTSLSPLLDASFRGQIARDVERIKKEFDAIYRRTEALRLKEAVGRKYSSNEGVYKRDPTGHLPTDPVFLGRDREMEQLREMLLADHGGGQMNVEVIAVVGMGGAGKTTLAQHVYKDPEFTRNFEKIGWLHVSENFDVIGLIKAVIETFSGYSSPNQLSLLQNEVLRLIEDKKVLIVMDDVWNTQSWDSFVTPFHHGAKKGSKILVTTRFPKVANGVRAVKSFKLSFLSEEDGWHVLKKHAFPNPSNEVDNFEELADVGKDIVKKCGGLPLSIKVLGRLLCSKGNDEDGWREVLRSNLLDVEHGVQENEQILGSLYLSYLYLSPKHKACFKICATYPNDGISSRRLKYSWMAHDLINDEREATECLYELESRSFLDLKHRHFDGDYCKEILMHDHIYDLAQFVLGEKHKESDYYVFPEEPTPVDFLAGHASLTNPVQVNEDFFLGSRHASLTFRNTPRQFLNTWRVYIDMKVTKLRTLELVETERDETGWVSPRVVNVRMSSGQCIRDLYIYIDALCVTSQSHFKCLRVLIIHGTHHDPNRRSIPHWVSQLYNLRYLEVRRLRVEILSDSIFDLRNLRWLILERSKITYLSEAISSLTNLRELNMKDSEVTYLPEAISRLTNLRGLNVKGSRITFLPEAISRLTNLRELNVEGSQITYLPKTISELFNLQKLSLNECYDFGKLPEGITNLTNLRVLNLRHTPISFMPKGFGALTKLEYLTNYAISSTEAGIAELKNMKHLKEIQIENLRKVASEEDAAQAEMANKNHLRVLFLCWSEVVYKGDARALMGYFEYYDGYLGTSNRGSDRSIDETHGQSDRGNQERNAHQEEGIFEQLRPHPVIKQLFIGDYGGFKLPIWMGDQSFTNLVRLHLYEVDYCTSLSPMDRLPSLDRLALECMDSLVELIPDQNVGCVGIMHPATEQGQSTTNLWCLHFTDCNSLEHLPLHRFTSPECLALESMDSLVELVPDQSVGRAGVMHPATEQGQSFPKLRRLDIIDCKSLEYLPLHRLTTMYYVTVSKCSNLKRISYKITGPTRATTSVRIDTFPGLLYFPP